MRAITIPSFGPASVLTPASVETPTPGPGQVAIDVGFAGVNFAEVLYRRGLVDVPLPFVPGIEVAGRVRALGAGVTGPPVGTPVAALTVVDSGGYAGVAVTDARLVAPLGDVPPRTAAAVPSNSTTAFLALDLVARLRPGESVLVHAAAGGLGSQLGQVARLLGAGRVVGTVGSAAKIDAARAFGYPEVVLRDAVTGSFDVVVDMVGGPARRLDLLAPLGRLVVLGNASDALDVAVSANRLWLSSTAVLGFNLAAVSAHRPAEVGAALRRAVRAVAAGELRVDVEALPFDAAAEAHRRIEAGTTTGKLVLDLTPVRR
ncbi:quinone oxidoreductase family protein [Cryptosporangium japonicum]|uniref:Zinc-binding dehydrogenase n=1 Tax=Cryptosporangium japonicum TaxID=80872 RepID=A0ABN0UK28_9ACTN